MTDDERGYFEHQVDRIDYLIGQVAALKAFCVAVIASHKDPSLLMHATAKIGEINVAQALPTPATDATLKGMEDVQAALMRTFADRGGR
jgi:hypothetical protein